jgi:cobalt/nickel transport system permease protein
MHIPDGYLGPATCVVFYGAMSPLWYVGARRVEAGLGARGLPRLSLASAFVFVLMMFNFPLPGGTSGHLVGAAILAVTLGPWAAFIAISLALFIQALVFGDGGVTALGANVFNMAFLMSFTAYAVHGLLAGPIREKGLRSFMAAALAGYVSVIAAALAVALELGVQPLIAVDVAGNPLYAPYHLGVTLPAVLIPHLLFFGPVEALGTALVLRSLGEGARRVAPRPAHGVSGRERPLWWGLSALVIMTPLGLAASGAPWGEWSPEAFGEIFGFLPEGMAWLGGLWRGIMPGYGIGALAPRFGALGSALVYILSAAMGSALIVFFVYLWGRLWQKNP